MSKSFDEFFEKELTPALSDPDRFEEAVEVLQNNMPEMETSTDRSKVYQWLGTVHLSLASQALAVNLAHEAHEQFALVEEYQGKAIEEDPARIEPRLNLARYYLTFGGTPQNALDVLDVEDVAAGEDPSTLEMTFEHQRRALRGVAFTMLGQEGEAARALDGAYSDRFAGKIPPRAVDVPSLLYLASRGIKFTRQSAEAIVAQIRKMGVPEEELPGTLVDQFSR